MGFNSGFKGLNCDVQESNIIRFNPLNAELNPICYLPALLGAHHFLHVSRIRVNGLNSSVIQEAVCRRRGLRGQTGNVPLNVTLRRVCATIVVMEKAISINIF